METSVTSTFPALFLAQNGKRQEAEDLIRRDPENAESLLVKGYLDLASNPDQAKDLLAKARRLLPAPLSHLAGIYEARAYEYLGQTAEGRLLISAILKEPLSPDIEAQALLVRAVFDLETPKRALGILNRIVMDGLPPGLKARVHNLRALMNSELEEFDRALIEYAGAAAFFDEADDCNGRAHALNNRSSVERKLGQYNEAHTSVDQAIALLNQSDPFLSPFKDQKARIYIAEKNFAEAERVAREAVSLVENTDRNGFLVDALSTLGTALAGLGRHCEGSVAFSRAYEIASQLNNHDLLFKVTRARKKAAEEFLESAELELIELALTICHGSYRAAAKKLEMSHTGLLKALARNGVQWKPKRPRSIISK